MGRHGTCASSCRQPSVGSTTVRSNRVERDDFGLAGGAGAARACSRVSSGLEMEGRCGGDLQQGGRASGREAACDDDRRSCLFETCNGEQAGVCGDLERRHHVGICRGEAVGEYTNVGWRGNNLCRCRARLRGRHLGLKLSMTIQKRALSQHRPGPAAWEAGGELGLVHAQAAGAMDGFAWIHPCRVGS